MSIVTDLIGEHVVINPEVGNPEKGVIRAIYHSDGCIQAIVAVEHFGKVVLREFDFESLELM